MVACAGTFFKMGSMTCLRLLMRMLFQICLMLILLTTNAHGATPLPEIVTQDGRILNPSFTDYILPTSADLPPIRVFFQEDPYEYGGGGSKGLGELPHDGPAPAIAGAVTHALGVFPHRIPLMPEMLMELLDQAGRRNIRYTDSRIGR